MKYCGQCGETFDTGDTFCIHCGIELAVHSATSTKSCLSCNKVYHTDDNFCIHCGEHLLKRDPEKKKTMIMKGVLRQSKSSKKCDSCNIHYHKSDQFCMHCGDKLSQAEKTLIQREIAHDVLDAEKKAERGRKQELRAISSHVKGMDQSLAKVLLERDIDIEKMQQSAERYETRIKKLEERERALKDKLQKVAAGREEEIDNLRKEFLETTNRLQNIEEILKETKKEKEQFSRNVKILQERPKVVEGDKIIEKEKNQDLATYAEDVDKTLANIALEKNAEIRKLRQGIAALEKQLEQKSDDQKLQDQLDIYWGRLKKIEEVSKAVGERRAEIDRLSHHTKNIDKTLTAIALEKEMEIGQLRRQLTEHIHRMERVEARLWAEKETEKTFGPPNNVDQFSKKLLDVVEQQEKNDIKTMEKKLTKSLEQKTEPFEQQVTQNVIAIKKLRNDVEEKSKEFKHDIAAFQDSLETDNNRVIEKQVAENAIAVARVQKGLGKIYAQIGGLMTQKKKWGAIIDKEIKGRVKQLMREQKREEKSISKIQHDISNEFSKINILLNHNENRLDMFMQETKDRFQELKEKRDPEVFTRFAGSVVGELDEIKFRMKNMEHKTIHNDMEEIIDTVTDLERKIDQLRIVQPIIVE